MSWQKKELGNLAEIGDGNHSSKYPKSSEFLTEGVPFIRSVNLINGNIGDSDMKFISPEKHQQLLKGHLKTGDILFTNRGQIGKMAIVPLKYNNSNLNSQTAWIRSSVEVYNKYLYYQLGSKMVLGKIIDNTNGTALQQLTITELKKILIPLPSLPEQQKIAEILSTVDAKIEVIDEQITETQALKKGLMQRLLTKGIGHTEFKDSPLGEIPKSWEVVKFSELISKGVISKIQDGNHGEIHPISSDFVNEGIPFIMANCISTSNKLDIEKAKRISLSKYKSLRIGFSEPDDVLLTHKGTVGLTAIVEERHGSLMLTPQVTYYRIENKSILNNKYLYYYFQSSIFQELINKFSKQSTRAYIGITAQKNLPIIMPINILEQNRIADILSSLDEKLNVLSEKKTHYHELKQGLMQQLLTGKIRVV